MTENARNWIVESLSGVNLIPILALLASSIYFVVESRATINYMSERIATLEAQLDVMRSNNTQIEILRLTIDNLTTNLNRADTKTTTLQAQLQQLQANVRDLERARN